MSADLPDVRDRIYEPRLAPLPERLGPPERVQVLDQGREGACTGFALAAVIHRLYEQRGKPVRVSARMLYEMGRRYDEWPGTTHVGSSCRGVLRGWLNMGVCREELWPSARSRRAVVTRERAEDAAAHTLGAYYRLRRELVDFQSALLETGAVLASARVHAGWERPVKGEIRRGPEVVGAHAFAIVGYDALGFWVQNSWGPGWGNQGLARWPYEDWAENLLDAWVLQLAPPAPRVRIALAGAHRAGSERAALGAPARHEIAGHFVHLDDGAFCESGRYFTSREDVAAIAQTLATTTDYDHVLLWAHGGLVTPKRAARTLRDLAPVWKAHRVYPLHFLYDTGLGEETLDLLFGPRGRATAPGLGAETWDRLLERAAAPVGRALWREMKADAYRPFRAGAAGDEVLAALSGALARAPHPKKLHLVGHSNGAHFLTALLTRLGARHPEQRVTTCSLLAPACPAAHFDEHFRPALAEGRLGELGIYVLSPKAERADSVGPYRKSLLHLVARAFEDGPLPRPLLGLAEDLAALELGRLPARIYTASPKGPASTASSHGGFDEDAATLDHVLGRVLGRRPKRGFSLA